MSQRYFTTPIYYVNARPHLGHAYTTILADVLKREALQRGNPVYFLTGTDEHGEKIARMATQAGQTPKELVDEVSADFRSTWEKMGLSFDRFYRTTEPEHITAVQKALQLLKDKGEIVFREYEGQYCVGCERFLTESELTADKKCPDHLTLPEFRKEGNYFFLMSRYQKPLIEYFTAHPDSIRPEHFRQEILSLLQNQPLTDLCISRPKERLTWGIEIPFDTGYVTYVWFDALLNYLVATGWPDANWNQARWAGATHLIAKDIVKTHSIYWGAMLMALGVPLPKLQVSGYWLVDGTKMSKSLGNVVRPLEVEALYGAETLRFFLLKEMSYGLDSTFTLEGYIHAINAYLANGIGNLASRVLTIAHKNAEILNSVTASPQTDLETALLDKRAPLIKEWNEGFAELKYHHALKAWCETVTACDLYINETKPWALVKDPTQAPRLKQVLETCAQMLQCLAVVIYPVLPAASRQLSQALRMEWIKNTGVDAYPAIELALEARTQSVIPEFVPKLFMRVSLPKEA